MMDEPFSSMPQMQSAAKQGVKANVPQKSINNINFTEAIQTLVFFS
jgi:hypothetical protein